MKKIELNNSTCIYSKDNLITVYIKPSSLIEATDVLEIRAANEKLTQGKSYVILMLVGEYSVLSKEAREIASKQEYGNTRKAMAFVINGLPHRIIGNFFINVNKPPTPTKIFNSRKEAEEWLLPFQKKIAKL